MSEGSASKGAIPARQLSVEEYQRLGEIGVLGEKIALIDGRIYCGDYPFMFSAQAVAPARAAGIELADTG
jgi:hypothetical protein